MLLSFLPVVGTKAVERMQAIHARFEELQAKHRMSKADGVEMDELGEEFDALNSHVEKLDRCAAIAGAAGGVEKLIREMKARVHRN